MVSFGGIYTTRTWSELIPCSACHKLRQGSEFILYRKEHIENGIYRFFCVRCMSKHKSKEIFIEDIKEQKRGFMKTGNLEIWVVYFMDDFLVRRSWIYGKHTLPEEIQPQFESYCKKMNLNLDFHFRNCNFLE